MNEQSAQRRKVVVVPHDPTWRDKYEREASEVQRALGRNVVTVHHIGSTSIPGIYAKPIVDMLVEVDDIAAVDSRNDAMTALGYEVMGEYGIPARRYFRKDNANGERQFHVHAFTVSSAEALRHLAFRDFLRAHPDLARDYSLLKQQLATMHPDSIEDYMDGKDGFIKEMQERALTWQETK